MNNLQIHFSNPLFLLLLLPAIAVVLIPFFRVSKRYRNTRNRISAVVLHLTVFLLCTLTLAGMTFTYSLPNDGNEIILLVDMSETENQSPDARDEFIDTVLRQSKFDYCKVGIVTFGFNQKYVAPLSTDTDKVYSQYMNADAPDTSATNIADALTYAKTLFTHEEAGKIVLITDGKETDNDAMNVIKTVVASGITVDTVNIPSKYDVSNAQIVETLLPEYHVNVGEECEISIVVRSNYETGAAVKLYDNDESIDTETQSLMLVKGDNNITFKHTFVEGGLHKISFEVNADNDEMEDNNVYSSYFYLDVFNNVLVIESEPDTSGVIEEILTQKDALTQEEMFKVTVKGIFDEDLPTAIDDLLKYDQIILNNIANADMPDGFADTLYDYVYSYGGGLFTAGGDEGGVPHAYNEDDMSGTVFQQMLPVQAIEYTPPVGVMIIIDTSGSMSEMTGGRSYLEWAKSGAQSCLNALTERDYVGIMTLDTYYSTVLELTPRTKEAQILAAIETLEEANGGTVFPGAIERAGQALRSLRTVDKRHIILVTDGGVPEEQRDFYESFINEYYVNDGITLSVVLIGSSAASTEGQLMKAATEIGHGRLHAVTNSAELVREMREDLKAPDIKAFVQEPFYPIVNDPTSAIFEGVEYGTSAEADNAKCLTVQLEGFYGAKKKMNADVLLVGDYDVPVYAQWKFGKGLVGSFMCDLNGVWSNSFTSSTDGQRFIQNVVGNLMPTTDIRPSEINYKLREQNYTNRLEIYNTKDGERIEGVIVDTSDETKTVSLNSKTNENSDVYVISELNANNNYGRANFIIKKSGVYRIELTKFDKDGNVLATTELFKTFSYSAEYDTFEEESEDEEIQKKLTTLAKAGNGKLVADNEDPWEIFDQFSAYLGRRYDPRMLFMILSLTLFLLEICVRKFKFKWIHELVKDYKEKKEKTK